MKTVTNIVKNVPCKIQIALSMKAGSYLNNPASRAAFLTGAYSVYGIQAAVAQDGGFAGVGTTVAEQGTSLADSGSTIFMAVGFIIAGWGGLNMYKRSRETRDDGQPQTPVTKIVGPMVAGAVLAATGTFMKFGGETLGVDESNYGTVPGS